MKVQIKKKNKLIANAELYQNFLLKAKGLMFSRKLRDNKAIILESYQEGILTTSIHMLFVFYPLNVIWLNSNKEVVDIKKAKPFISLLSPTKPAKYIIEMTNTPNLKVGDKLEFV